jgi:phosphate:Na+ symporter
LLATIKSNRQALKVGLFHVGFNFVTIVMGLLLVHPFTDLVIWISGSAPVSRSIANAHMLFNILGVLVFLPFASRIADLMDQCMPERQHAPASVGVRTKELA